MSEQAATTIIISPRDRYTGLLDCITGLYQHTAQPFKLRVLDLDYPEHVMAPVREFLSTKTDARIIELGLRVPMAALAAVRDDIDTPSVVLLDNDTRVTEGWLPPLLAALDVDVAVVTPLVLERLGVDAGADLRNHLYTGELRRVQAEGKPWLIEQKNYRRTAVDQIPRVAADTGTFELHCAMFDSVTFKAIELPEAVVREHLDIALQIRARGQRMRVEPASTVIFDNLGTRMHRTDMRYFWFRWSRSKTAHSAQLFEKRWGCRFYTEQAMDNWVIRRKSFLLARWLGLPVSLSNKVAGLARRLFCRDWDPLADAEAESRPLTAGEPVQLSHDIR